MCTLSGPPECDRTKVCDLTPLELNESHLPTLREVRQKHSEGLRPRRQARHITEFFPSCAAWEPAGLLASARPPARSEHPVAGACGQEPTTGTRCLEWCPTGTE